MADDALFVPDGDRFVPSELTRGGWSDHAQHGGPPVGLVAHVIEQRHAAPDMMITRLTTDLIRPVPLAP
ncbi:MAG: thioesterase family protein, partial [Acidimicrobiia bacterium]|nr:thioesterase family protein [Acidimicrobiia bacterium]